MIKTNKAIYDQGRIENCHVPEQRAPWGHKVSSLSQSESLLTLAQSMKLAYLISEIEAVEFEIFCLGIDTCMEVSHFNIFEISCFGTIKHKITHIIKNIIWEIFQKMFSEKYT